MNISNAMLLRFASGVPYGFRDRQRFELVPKITCWKKMCKQSSQQPDHNLFFHEYENNTHKAEQALPAWRGAGRSGRGTSRCCPAATVPAAGVSACGVCCCIAERKQNKIINRKTELCHHRPRSKAHSNEYDNNTHKAEQSLPAWRQRRRE